jgi:nitrate/TMAO reductase-like tetraheme cytochrome c subunit
MTITAYVRSVCALVCLVWGASTLAAAGVNDTCLACHGVPGAKSDAGRSIAVDGPAFSASIHGQLNLDCTACHADVSPTKIPHAEKLARVDCSTCHAQQVKEYAETVHGKARAAGNNVAATCTDCHGQHDILSAKDPASRTNHANLEATCSKCHGNEKLVQTAKLPGGNIDSQFHDSIHGKLLAGSARPADAPTCTNCHGAHSIRAPSEEASRVNRAHIPETCGSCHQAIYARFSKGQHGKLRNEGNPAVPVCSDCHTAHQIQRHDLPAFQTAVIEQCGNCHSEYLSTYRDTFHGQVTKLGYTSVATCASCHSAHDMLPASNPASTVSAQNRVNTCRKCHALVTANFASFDPHANRHDKARNPLYWYAAKFMDWLLIGVFSFFGIHTLVWLGRLWIDKFRARKRG